MKVLAIFDDSEIASSVAALRKLQHSVELVTDVPTALSTLNSRSFDVILCQATIAGKKQEPVNLLESIRSSSFQSDIPFICCQSKQDELNEKEFVDLTKSINAMGGQGLIEHRIFHSRNLVHAISRRLAAAVGSPCQVSEWR